MTAVASTLTDVALGIRHVTRVEIHCDAANLRSVLSLDASDTGWLASSIIRLRRRARPVVR
ncbi:hypothetical protein A3K89_09350 [Rhodococcoides kyotonense]|uniref:Uncharacterized protein n=1 Tax=Rhodococcoides kyotonense TaxID=398843 RepID=A0A177Y8N5_9NOCA|nr:hypothetical protein A3K89_09350 [Rhodococcus kyotonensis]